MLIKKKIKDLRIYVAIFFLSLSLLAYFLVLPFLYNLIQIANSNTYYETEENLSEINYLIESKVGKSLISDEYFQMASEIESLLSQRSALINKLDNQIKYRWWMFFLPAKYKEHREKEAIAIDFLKNSSTDLQKLKSVEYTFQRLLNYLQSYEEKVAYGYEDTDWEQYIAEATAATSEGEVLARQSAEYLKQGIITKELDDYIHQTVQINNTFFANFFDPRYEVDQNFILKKLEKSIVEFKKRPDITQAVATWRETIINPISSSEKENYEQFLKAKSTADQYQSDNNLSSDLINTILKKTKILKVHESQVTPAEVVEEIKADLDGEGTKDTLRVYNTDPADETQTSLSLVAMDKRGVEMGKLSKSMLINKPLSDGIRIHNLQADQKQQIVSFEFPVSPYSSETIFFMLNKDQKEIVPMCLNENPQDRQDCSFWSSEVGGLIVSDFDYDGKLEVVETVYEYPKDGKISKEDERAIEEAFSDEGLDQETVDKAKRVAIREAGGKGSTVIWRIFKINNGYFEEQVGANYDKYFDLVTKYQKSNNINPATLTKRSEISKESEDYNIFVRNLWTDRE